MLSSILPFAVLHDINQICSLAPATRYHKSNTTHYVPQVVGRPLIKHKIRLSAPRNTVYHILGK
nr:MAG TPA: hypothetical protein [Caudoviricetes sp.]